MLNILGTQQYITVFTHVIINEEIVRCKKLASFKKIKLTINFSGQAYKPAQPDRGMQKLP